MKKEFYYEEITDGFKIYDLDDNYIGFIYSDYDNIDFDRAVLEDCDTLGEVYASFENVACYY